jgi:hypothetical protein
MVLALDYMNRAGTATPETKRQFLEKIQVGYERLLGFEVKEEPGGFDWWGKAPANLFLTAYGLMSFRDLSEVYPVDPALIARIVAWLEAKQKEDGSWDPDGIRTGWSTDMAKGRSFLLTAYCAWGLGRAGAPSEKALAWLSAHADGAQDPYGLALAALAFLSSDPKSAQGRALVARVAEMRARDAKGVHWVPEGETGIGARGDSAAIETTALAIQALLLEGSRASLAGDGLERLVQWRSANGTFGTTQSTILALKALLAADPGAKRELVDVHVGHGAGEPRTVRLLPDSTQPERLDLESLPGGALEVGQEGEGRTRVSFARTAWLPWSAPVTESGRLDLSVRWPEEVLPAGQRSEAVVTIRNHAKEAASVVTIEVGLPPGCDLEPKDVQGEGAESVEREETRLVIYLRALEPGQSRTFRLSFRPRYALDVRTAPSRAYEYYVPEEAVTVPPSRLRASR